MYGVPPNRREARIEEGRSEQLHIERRRPAGAQPGAGRVGCACPHCRVETAAMESGCDAGSTLRDTAIFSTRARPTAN